MIDFLLSLLITPAYAAEAVMPIRVEIVQVHDIEGMLDFCDERGIDCSHLEPPTDTQDDQPDPADSGGVHLE